MNTYRTSKICGALAVYLFSFAGVHCGSDDSSSGSSSDAGAGGSVLAGGSGGSAAAGAGGASATGAGGASATRSSSSGSGAGGSSAALGSGGGTSQGSCTAGVAGDAMISSLGASDLQKVCDYTACLSAANASALKKTSCATAGILAAALGESCTDAYNQCLTAASDGGTSDQTCDLSGGSQCNVTVSQYTTCMNDTFAAYATFANSFSCDQPSESTSTLTQSPASCAVVTQNCSN